MTPPALLRQLVMASITMLCIHSSFAADRQATNERAGVSGKVVDASPRAKIGEAEDARKALAALDELLRAFESGKLDAMREKFDPALIGYQKIMEDIAQEQNQCKQIRVNLLNTQVQADAPLAVVETSWEKRCLLLPGMTPKLTTGRSTVIFHPGARGWIFSGISGGNMLERSSAPTSVARKTIANLVVTNTGASYAATSVARVSQLPFSIVVTDPDRAGAASVNVTVNTASRFANDTVLVTLPAVSPGSAQFAVTSMAFSRAGGGCTGPATPANPAVLEICSGGTATVTFNDTTTLSGTPQALTQSVPLP